MIQSIRMILAGALALASGVAGPAMASPRSQNGDTARFLEEVRQWTRSAAPTEEALPGGARLLRLPRGAGFYIGGFRRPDGGFTLSCTDNPVATLERLLLQPVKARTDAQGRGARMSGRRAWVAALIVMALSAPVCSAPSWGATITLLNTDDPGEGLNDPTPAPPLSSNPGVTLGDQRRYVLERAAKVWGGVLESDVEIRVEVSFDPLPCSPIFSYGGAGGWISSMSDFSGAQFPFTWYPIALANKLAGVDLDPGPPESNNDIFIIFNSDAALPECFGQPFYLGTDDQHGTAVDLFPLVLHEIGHGLGFGNSVDETTGSNFGGQTDVYSHFTLDTTLGQTWSNLDPGPVDDATRAASALRCGKISWNGPSVTAAVPSILDPGTPTLTVTSPAGLAGDYLAGKSTFGALLTPGGVSSEVEVAIDGTGAPADACEPLVGFTPGNIALVDRGTCFFVVKAANAQAAGAVGVLVADNVAGCPPPEIGGTDPSITIPVVRISLEDGLLLKGQLPAPGVTATLRLDSRPLGADAANHALLYAADPVAPASSISHWDSSVHPNLVMEPFGNPDLRINVTGLDLTPSLMRDLGWFNTDLSIVQSESADPVPSNAVFSYFLDVRNGGSGTDSPVTVTSILPAGTQFFSAAGVGWSCNPGPGTVTCTRVAVPRPDLPHGPAPRITITLIAPPAPGVVSNIATVSAPQPLADLVPGNNSATATTTIVQSGFNGTAEIPTLSVTGWIVFTLVLLGLASRRLLKRGS